MGTGFTPQRIAAHLEQAEAFWRGQRSQAMVSLYTDHSYRQDRDLAHMVSEACRCILADGASPETGLLPCFWPDLGTVSTAAMWGGRKIWPGESGCVHIEPVAAAAGQLDTLMPRPFEESDFALALQLHAEVCRRLETNEVFVRIPDFQGPLNTLALLLDQSEFMIAMYDNPAVLHRMLDRVTDVLIDTVSRFIRLAGAERVAGGIWPYFTLPPHLGVMITEDYMPLLGPEQYIEFGLPYTRRIAAAFGGVYIHCCGEYARHLPALAAADFKIWGLESAFPQTPVWEVWEAFGDRIAYVVGVSPDGLDRFPTVVEYAEQVATMPCGQGRYWFAGAAPTVDAARLHQVAARLGPSAIG